MRMVDAKKEIENKLFVGAPLSFDAMMCALAALTSSARSLPLQRKQVGDEWLFFCL